MEVEFDLKPLSAEDRTWTAKAQELELGALSAMRSSAEKWAAALTSALGVVSLAALLVGPGVFKHLSPSNKVAAEVAFFVAAFISMIATALATLAAQNARTMIVGRSGTAFKDWATKQTNKWYTALVVSRWLAGCAVLLIFTSGAILWFGDQTKEGPTVIDVQGTSLCPEASSHAVATIKGAEYLLRCDH
jgi:hypothetical protein